jgi:hypothetical protein
MMEKKLAILGYMTILVALLSFQVFAMNIGASPASVNFKQVLRGGYSERSIIISSDSSFPLIVDVNPDGYTSSWFNISEKNFSVTKDQPYSLKLTVNPPKDIPNGNYTSFLRFKMRGSAVSKEGQATGTIIPSIDLAVNTEVVDTEIVKCQVSSFNVNSVEKGDDVVFNLDISNSGNIRLSPKVKIELWDKDQTGIVKSQEFKGSEILPSTSGAVSLRMKTGDLDISQYWAEVTAVDCSSSKLLTFDVLDIGALKAEGVLLDINVKNNVETGETTPVVARFQNIGQKEVDAQFKGKISQGNKIIQLLESEKVNVPIMEVNRFNFYFTPNKPGKYVVSGNVFYSNKKTFESSSIINVISKKFTINSFLTTFAYIIFCIIIILLIIILTYKINKERKKYSTKLRRLK